MTSGARSAPALFASLRERRLWAWALAVVVGIFSTLGLARTLADELRNRDLLDTTFAWGALMILAAVVALGLKIRPGGAEIGIALGAIAVYLMVFLRMGIPEERTHLIEYSVLAVFIYEALKERAGQGRRVPAPAVLAFAATAAVGTFDEVIQAVLPSRVFDPIDIGFNVLAGFMAVTVSAALSRASARRRSRT